MKIEGMTDKEKRQAIALAHLRIRPLGKGWIEVNASSAHAGNTRSDDEVPDYPNDLNAIHSVVISSRHDRQWYWKYYCILESIVAKANEKTMETRYASEATAAERTDAFLISLPEPQPANG